MGSRRTDGGFTLLELLVVLAILSLTLVVTIPAISSGDQLRLDSAAQSLAASLRKTRSLATTTNHPQALTLDLEKQTFEISGQPGQTSLPSDTQVSVFTARSQLQSNTRASVRFFADGSSTGGRITLARAGREVLIDIDWLTGRVKILAPDQ